MRAPFLIRFPRFLSSPLWLAGLLYPALLVAQTAEEALRYQIGDRARESIIATETIRITDPGKHPNIFIEVRKTIPPVYGYTKAASQQSADQLTNSWNSTRDNFLDSLQQVFGKRKFRNVEISSEPFSTLMDGIQAGNKGFPFTDGLARRWAAGNLATNDLEGHSARLDAFMTTYFIRSDESPGLNESNHEKIDLITIGAKEPKNLDELAKHPVAQIVKAIYTGFSGPRNLPPSIGSSKSRIKNLPESIRSAKYEIYGSTIH